jgi:LytS/YehU family sensor histidine kinase
VTNERDTRNYISIEISQPIKNTIQIVCENSKYAVQILKKNSGGIGLINLKQRLEILYKNKYSLEFIVEEKIYKVILNIQLEEYTAP